VRQSGDTTEVTQEPPKVEVNGVMMTRQEWREFMKECPHESFSHPGVELMDGSRCRFATAASSSSTRRLQK